MQEFGCFWVLEVVFFVDHEGFLANSNDDGTDFADCKRAGSFKLAQECAVELANLLNVAEHQADIALLARNKGETEERESERKRDSEGAKGVGIQCDY